ncbi:MAG: MotA/TolQ/ExbB proton channel family protein [Gammaproteobacteria bacterium]|nr:MotA/TolQ/ExbB proton channel family protein [Gammaproteobacteria bacterium]
MNRVTLRWTGAAFAVLLGISLFINASAQDASTAEAAGRVDTTASGASGAADQAAAEQGARAELEAAYQQEYAFLVAQKRALQARIESFRGQGQAEVSQTEQRIDTLQGSVLGLDSDAKGLRQSMNVLQRQREAARQNADILDATFQQARTTFGEYGRRALMSRQSFADRGEAGRLAAVFTRARGLLRDLTSIRQQPGAFFSREGRKLEGTLIRVGDIATFGVAGDAAGALAPAGGGELKVWEQASADDARALAEGRTPDQLGMFLYDSLDTAAPTEESEGVIAHIHSGGPVAWVIVAVGVLALLLILTRIVLLKRAGTSTGRIVRAVGEKLEKRDIDGALDVCERRKGAAANVVAAALKNIHRDREQLEDVINEAMLRENTRLERFGSLIMVISAVSPLLGLLGTVIGMITTFEVITQFGTGDPALLAGGIAIALVNTELGLAVAIPALLIGSMLSSWADRIKDDMLKAALRVTNHYEDVETAAMRKAA